MADFARGSGIEVEVATFEAWDPRGRTFDAVISGQAWHWVDPVLGATKAAQVLGGGGRIALFWNVFQPPADVAAAFVTAYQRVVPDSPFDVSVMTSRPSTPTRRCSPWPSTGSGRGRIGRLEQWRFDWEQHYSRDEWLALFPPRVRSPGSRRTSSARCWTAVGAAIDAMGGSFTMQYATVVVTAERARPEPASPGAS